MSAARFTLCRCVAPSFFFFFFFVRVPFVLFCFVFFVRLLFFFFFFSYFAVLPFFCRRRFHESPFGPLAKRERPRPPPGPAPFPPRKLQLQLSKRATWSAIGAATIARIVYNKKKNKKENETNTMRRRIHLGIWEHLLSLKPSKTQ